PDWRRAASRRKERSQRRPWLRCLGSVARAGIASAGKCGYDGFSPRRRGIVRRRWRGKNRLDADALTVRVVATPGDLGPRLAPGVPAGVSAARCGERDAIDRADRQAQLAAGAQIVDDGVHALGRTDDGVGP